MFRKFKKPVPLTRQIVGFVKSKYFAVSRKCDGQLVALTVSNNTLRIYDINNHELNNFKTDVKFKFVVYGEYYKNVCYVFDISLIKLSYFKRYEILKSIVKNEPKLKINPVIFGVNIFNFINKLPKVDFVSDGYIFTPNDSDLPTYKWKDYKNLTADLLIKNGACYAAISIDQYHKLPSALQCADDLVKNYFSLKFNHLNNLNAYKFKDDDKKYEGKIVECLYRNECWTPVQIRWDKTEQMNSSTEFCGPNNWKTVNDIYEETLNPILYEELENF